jgi:hypothetical protein
MIQVHGVLYTRAMYLVMEKWAVQRRWRAGMSRSVVVLPPVATQGVGADVGGGGKPEACQCGERHNP